jgi:transcriptional activator of eps genes
LNKFLASWSGCDGGNPKASIWICGIEHGGACEPDTPLCEEKNPGAWDEKFISSHPDFRTWQYHRKVAKLMLAIARLRKPRREGHAKDYLAYMKEELYVRDGDTFKLNLFPFSSPSTSPSHWERVYEPVLEMTRQEYGELCHQDRFSFFAGKRREYSPKVVLGTGKTYRNSFAHAFGFPDMPPERFFIGQRECWRYKDYGSTLIVTPFFGGRWGMNSDALLEELAKEIAGILTPPAP